MLTLDGFTQVVHKATRATDSSETLIDIINTNNPEFISSEGVFHIGIDHNQKLRPIL